MLVWYAAYGSNLSRDRFLHYLQGGCPPGARRRQTGSRDRTPPVSDRAVRLPGRLHFGWESPTWGGGIAFYDATGEGQVLSRAYLLTSEQFSDVATQEMHREPGGGAELDLAPVLAAPGRHVYGPGRYETVHRVGTLDGAPVLTFTADRPERLTPTPPVAAYLRMLAAGLAESHRCGLDDVVDYLRLSPVVAASWSRTALSEALAGDPTGPVPDPI